MMFKRGSVAVVMQSELAECGLACLAMICSQYGYEIDLRALRLRFPQARNGMTLLSIVRSAEALGFSARAVKASIQVVDKLSLPAILHWHGNHFVVLVRATATALIIHDPGRGRVTVSRSEFENAYSGYAAELHPIAPFEKKKEKTSISAFSLFEGAPGLQAGLLQLLVVMLGLQAAILLTPLLTQVAVDEATATGDISLLYILFVAGLCLLAVKVVLTIAEGWISVHLATRLNFFASSRLFRHLLRLPASFFETRHLGDIQVRFGAIHQVQTAVTTHLVGFVMDALIIIGLSTTVLIYSPVLSAVVFLGIAAYAMMRWILYSKLRSASEQLAVHQGMEATVLLESLNAVRSIKIAGRLGQRHRVFDMAAIRKLNASAAATRHTIVFNVINTLIFGIVAALTTLLALRAVIAGDFTLGMLIAFTAFQADLVQRSGSFIDRVVQWVLLSVPLERVADIALTDPEPKPSSAPTSQAEIAACEVIIKDLSFSYPGGPPLISHFNLRVQPTEIVAIKGPSGRGKSTLVKLLCGLLHADHGELRIQGRTVSASTRDSILNGVGVVLQDDILLTGSVAENIAFFDDDVDMDRVEAAARQALINDDIEALPMGYNSIIADMGSQFSGGQKQRILLARAFYRRPGLLILDEATSALDVETERRLFESIRGLQCTVVMIAHRPDALQAADRVVSIFCEDTRVSV
jgi:ATP-binding cassette subfamily B protein RaxB